MRAQVEKSHYVFDRYMTRKRWSSIWYQLREVMSFQPESVLEIGPGPGLFKNAALAFGVPVTTVDIDPGLNPDVVSAADDLPFENEAVDVSCAFQVLEHMPLEASLDALAEMCRVSRKATVISLPDAKTRWPCSITLPKFGRIEFQLSNPLFSPRPHIFDGEHYWEINKKGYELDSVLRRLVEATPGFTVVTALASENPYHRFFIFRRTNSLTG